MSLFSSVPMSKLTIYRKDYTKKTGFRPAQYSLNSDYKNPITGPSEDILLPYFKYKKLPQPQTEYANPKLFAECVAENYPSSRYYLKEPTGEPVNWDVIDDLYKDDNRTTYMVSYCKRGDYESKSTLGTRRMTLPEGWVLSYTTQRSSYRHPRLLAPEGLPKLTKSRPKDNLSPNQKEREILDVKTGETIYISDISNTGTEIINGKLHGDVNIRPKFDEDDLLKAMLIRTQ